MSAYEELIAVMGDVMALTKIGELLYWDQEVIMPSAGAFVRKKQLGTLYKISHGVLSQPRVKQLLDELEKSALDEVQKAAVREIRLVYNHMTRPSAALLKELAERQSTANLVWREARAKSDFALLEPHLTAIIELKRQQAQAIDSDKDPYAVLFADYEPHLTLDEASRLIEYVVKEVQEMRLMKKKAPRTDFLERRFSEEEQLEICKELAKALEYKGRLDVSAHPFSAQPADLRVTTRFSDGYVFALNGTAHEIGHAMYMQELPFEKYWGSPLGDHRGMTVHESQSGFYDNHLYLNKAFSKYFFNKLKEGFPAVFGDVSADEWYAANTCRKEGFIRVSSDELSYPLHIALRFRIEKEIFSGKTQVKDLPKRWMDLHEELFGVRPTNDSQGVLQDIHWSSGDFGYFPTYLLGSILAAQLWVALLIAHPNVEAELALGNLSTVKQWLFENIHSHGCRYTTQELIERATGKPLGAEDYIEHLRQRYT